MVLIATFSSEQHGYEYGRRCAAPAKPGEWRLAENQLGKRRLCVKILLTEKITLGISAVIGERWVVPRGQRTSGRTLSRAIASSGGAQGPDKMCYQE
jgi:hypothetical protein